MSAVTPESTRESAPLQGSSFSVFPGDPLVDLHWWDGSAKMLDDSQLYCQPKNRYTVKKEGS